MGFSTKIFLVDIKSEQDSDSGKRRLKIVNQTPVYADLQEVGLNEYYSAQSLKKKLVAVYEIPAHMYHNESYILVNNKQYHITRAAKGRSLGFIRLPCEECQKTDLILSQHDYPYSYPFVFEDEND